MAQYDLLCTVMKQVGYSTVSFYDSYPWRDDFYLFIAFNSNKQLVIPAMY